MKDERLKDIAVAAMKLFGDMLDVVVGAAPTGELSGDVEKTYCSVEAAGVEMLTAVRRDSRAMPFDVVIALLLMAVGRTGALDAAGGESGGGSAETSGCEFGRYDWRSLLPVDAPEVALVALEGLGQVTLAEVSKQDLAATAMVLSGGERVSPERAQRDMLVVMAVLTELASQSGDWQEWQRDCDAVLGRLCNGEAGEAVAHLVGEMPHPVAKRLATYVKSAAGLERMSKLAGVHVHSVVRVGLSAGGAPVSRIVEQLLRCDRWSRMVVAAEAHRRWKSAAN